MDKLVNKQWKLYFVSTMSMGSNSLSLEDSVCGMLSAILCCKLVMNCQSWLVCSLIHLSVRFPACNVKAPVCGVLKISDFSTFTNIALAEVG